MSRQSPQTSAASRLSAYSQTLPSTHIFVVSPDGSACVLRSPPLPIRRSQPSYGPPHDQPRDGAGSTSTVQWTACPYASSRGLHGLHRRGTWTSRLELPPCGSVGLHEQEVYASICYILPSRVPRRNALPSQQVHPRNSDSGEIIPRGNRVARQYHRSKIPREPLLVNGKWIHCGFPYPEKLLLNPRSTWRADTTANESGPC